MSSIASVDMTKGVYRRIYSGFLSSKKINSLSWATEAWFWRVHAIADDHGVFPADPTLCRAQAAPRRDMTLVDVEQRNQELLDAGLIRMYEVGGEMYAAIVGFEELQPAGKNGRRIQRYPHPVSGLASLCPSVPLDSPGITRIPPDSPGFPKPHIQNESGGAREIRPSYSDTDTEITTDTHTHSDVGASAGARVSWSEVAAIYAAYPKTRRGGKGDARRFIEQAIGDVTARGIPEPVPWLLGRVLAYAGSWAATREGGQFAVGLEKFMTGGVYDQDDGDWAQPHQNGTATGIDFARAARGGK